jgi:small subunit ribosomal protein S20
VDVGSRRFRSKVLPDGQQCRRLQGICKIERGSAARRTRVRTYLRKSLQEALTRGDVEAAKAAFIVAQSELMRAVSKGVVHKNTGSRKVSRLNAQLKKLSAA